MDLVSYAIILAVKKEPSVNRPSSAEMNNNSLVKKSGKTIISNVRIWNASVPSSHTISIWISMKIGERILLDESAKSGFLGKLGLLPHKLDLENTSRGATLKVLLLKYQGEQKRKLLRFFAQLSKNQGALKGLASVEDAPKLFNHFLNNTYLYESSLYEDPNWRNWSVEEFYHEMNLAVFKKAIARNSKL